MFSLRALLWQRDISRHRLNPNLNSTGIQLISLTSPAWQQRQQFCRRPCAHGNGESPLSRPLQPAKRDVPAHSRPTAEKLTRGPRTVAPQRQSREGSQAPRRGGTQAPQQPCSSEGRSNAQPLRSIHIPVEELKAKTSCEGVWDMLRNNDTSPRRIHVSILSAALDHMLVISKRPGYQQTQQDLSAVKRVLNLAEDRLGWVNSWTMAAYIRCAAGFKGVLQPAGLSAWQRELLQRPGLVEQLTQQGIANTLLSLGTLTESAPQLAHVLDLQLAGQLLQRAVSFAHTTSGPAALAMREAANVLYGAALLGLQPDRAQVAALFSAVQRDLGGLEKESLAQVLLASQKFLTRAAGLRDDQGLEARRPEVNPYNIYYPGNQLMGLLLERTCELVQRQQLYPRQASHILGACGSLGYLPSQEALTHLLAVLEKGELTIIHASTTLVGCARLDIMPTAEGLAACWQALMRDGGQDTQAVANVAWALALLGVCTPSMWETLTDLLWVNVNPTSEALPLIQWHQAYLLIKLQHPEGLACPPELLERSFGCPQSRAGKAVTSYTLGAGPSRGCATVGSGAADKGGVRGA